MWFLLSSIFQPFRGLFCRRLTLHCSKCSHSSIMQTEHSSVYQEAVYALNGLQSNAKILEKAREERSAKAHLTILNTEKHLKSLGIKLDHIDSLNIIHVAGTKGKGSTCAFSECILRKHGYKTGFFSSPHLMSVNERIRINGIPLQKEKFVTYFWEVYRGIQGSLVEGETMPFYFMFLTIMAFYVFIKEKVQATIVEVGLGGLFDSTNVIRKPIAVGIATLCFDHTSILGETLSEIAQQKAGILKKGVPAFTVPQHGSAMEVLCNAAKLVECPLMLCPPLEVYDQKVSLGIDGIIQGVNASLALQLTRTWLNRQSQSSSNSINISGHATYMNGIDCSLQCPPLIAETFHLDTQTQNALEKCVWAGRFQTLSKNGVTFYLDGAHTQQSMKHCARWFQTNTCNRQNEKSSALRVLLFNCTGDRKAEGLLDPLIDVPFDVVVFCPNTLSDMKDATSDLSNFMVEPGKELHQCYTNQKIWCHLLQSLNENEISVSSTTNFSSARTDTCETGSTIVCPSIHNALNYIFSHVKLCESGGQPENTVLGGSDSHVDVLVTGSLHLIGGVLSLIDS